MDRVPVGVSSRAATWIALVGLAGCFSRPELFGDGSVGDDAQPPDPDGGTSEANVMFVTSSTVAPGALGSVAAADAKCQELAMNAGLPTNTYLAWLAPSSTEAPSSRFVASRGWVRPDGKPVADTVADLDMGNLWYPPRLDEGGADSDSVFVATGARFAGMYSTCSDYTDPTEFVTVGLADSGGTTWQTGGMLSCASATQHLYCLGTAKSRVLTMTRDPAHRVAFVGSATVSGAAGRAPLNAECASVAMMAGLPGTYLAAVATSAASIASQFSPGPPWSRVDGVVVLDPQLDQSAPIIIGALGNRLAVQVWTGASSFETLPPPGETCGDWTDAAMMGKVGESARSGPGALGSTSGDCSTKKFVYCLQE